MQQKLRQKMGKSDEPSEETTMVNFRNADSARLSIKVKRGTPVKYFLASLKHQYRRGLTYKLNNVLLQVNKEGELLEDPALEGEEVTLVIQQTFTGGLK